MRVSASFLVYGACLKELYALDTHLSRRILREAVEPHKQADEYWERFLKRQTVEAYAFSFPTVSPTPRPTRKPISSSPTLDPTSRPGTMFPVTLSPSAAPMSPPAPSPISAPPVSLPTLVPTTLAPVPGTSPTAAPAVSTVSPSQLPTKTPVSTAVPTASPCSLNVSQICTGCENLNLTSTVCPSQPSQLVFRFTGGPCSQTNASQEIPCLDFNGGPPATNGSQSFIVVSFGSVTYFRGFVLVGGDFIVQDPTGAPLGSSQSIVVFSSNDTSPANVLQSLVFDASCTQTTLALKNQFGASELVAFTVNGVTTSAFAQIFVSIRTEVPSGSPRVILEEGFTESNTGFANLTSRIVGREVNATNPSVIGFLRTLDVTEPSTATFVSTIIGNTTSGSRCTGVSPLLTVPYGPQGSR